MPHAREQDSDALHVEGQGCGLGSQTALSAKSIVGRKMRLRAGTSALFRRRPLEISPLGRRHHGAQCRARALGAPPAVQGCHGEPSNSTQTSSCLPPGVTRRMASGNAQQQQISRRTVGAAVKLAKELAASMRRQSLDEKPRRLIQTEQMTTRYHASARIRTTGVAVEAGKERAGMHQRCVGRKVRPLTKPMRKRRTAGAATDVGREQPNVHPRRHGKKPRPRKPRPRKPRPRKPRPPMRNRPVGMSVCSECRPTAYGKAQASVRPRRLAKEQPRPLSPRRKWTR